MEKRLAVIFLALCACFSPLRAQDETEVFPSVTKYLESIMTEPVDTINAKVDSLVEALAPQGAQKQSTVAGLAFDFFCNSPIMGQEAVAVHIADSYFLNGRLKWNDESTYPFLYAFAEFNRSSLVGMPAPALRMNDMDSIPVSVRDIDSPYKVLFFYDTQCATCLEQTRALESFAGTYKGDHLTVVAVYTQANREFWETYVKEHFDSLTNPDISFVHLWDPEVESDFQRKYGLLTTPAIFLLDRQNTIMGRRLDVEALSGILTGQTTERLQFRTLFDRVVKAIEKPDDADAGLIADAFAARTEKDTSLFRRTMMNLMDYFREAEDYNLQLGAYVVAEKYIIGRPEYWSEEYVRSTVDMLARARITPMGSIAPDILLENKRFKLKPLLDCNTEYHLIMFHLVDCPECIAEVEALKKLNSKLYAADVSVTLVYVGSDDRKWKEFIRRYPSRWRYLCLGTQSAQARELYDLETVPRTFLLDGADCIIGRYFRIESLEEILDLL